MMALIVSYVLAVIAAERAGMPSAVRIALALLAVAALGMLERAGVSIWGFRELRDVWPLVALPYVVGLTIALRRYR